MAETIITVVLEVVKCLAPPTERQISYLRSYNNNFMNLKNEIEKMKNDRASVQHKVDEAIRQGEDIEKNVDEWLARVNKVIAEAEEFVGNEATANKHCLKGLCPNLKTRLQLSKETVRQQGAISELWEAGRFDRISYRSIPEDIGLKPSKYYEAFESRKSTLKNILCALKDPDVNMLGIYGMGGIGKTTLAKEVARQAESDKLFDQVVFAEVSQSQDIRKIQGEIADKLGLTFHEESESGRARSLCNRLKAEKWILVILDNIWEDLDLQAVGIPHEDDHKGCKVLLTARSEDVLSRKMDSQQNFSVGVLKEEEAWSLFKKMTGDYIESSQFKSVAMDVVKECDGLPISIVTVGKALRKKRLLDWNDALDQLRRPSSANFRNIQSAAYSAIKMSYNNLESEELKKIFLLIGYSDTKNIDYLLLKCMGLGLFQGINSIEKARAQVHILVQKLKESCMLLDDKSRDEEWFSMHDVIQDVAISIATTKQNGLMVKNGEPFNRWESLNESAFIVLLGVKTNVLPEVLECPKLEYFYLRAKRKSLSLTIPDKFFAMTKKVRVLDLTYMHLLSLPSSLCLLTNLRTLCLYECKLQDISIVGDLKNLEILCLQGSSIKQLPVEIGQLVLLRMLHLRECVELEVIPPNVLSKLSNLEELYIFDFNQWEMAVEEQKNASLDELKHLPKLTSLELHIKDVNTLPKSFFFKKLERYKICIGDKWSSREMWTQNSKAFKLQLNTNFGLKDGLIVSLKGTEGLCLSGLQDQDIKNFIYEFVKMDSLQLKHLEVTGCGAPNPRESKRLNDSTTDMWSNEIVSEDDSFFFEKVALPNLKSLILRSLYVERIWQSQLAAVFCGIQNLTNLTVHECRNLKFLFSSSIISSFVQLQNLNIEKCPALEEIIVMDQAEKKIVMFPQLQCLKMIDLEKLTSLCIGDPQIEFSSVKHLEIRKCPEFMVKYKNFNHDLIEKVSLFPNLEILKVDEKYIPQICQFLEDFICQLVICNVDLQTINSSLDLLQRFLTTKNLYLDGKIDDSATVEKGMTVVNKFCDMKHILKPSAILNDLENLVIMHLRCDNLINLVPSSTTFQNLIILDVWRCNGLIKLLTFSTAKSLVRLRQMIIRLCDMITEIVADDERDNSVRDEIIFRELKELRFHGLNSLTSFFSGNYALKFPYLKTLYVVGCPNMKIFSGGELSTPNLHEVKLSWYNKKRWIWERDLNTTIQQQYLKTKRID